MGSYTQFGASLNFTRTNGEVPETLPKELIDCLVNKYAHNRDEEYEIKTSEELDPLFRKWNIKGHVIAFSTEWKNAYNLDAYFETIIKKAADLGLITNGFVEAHHEHDGFFGLKIVNNTLRLFYSDELNDKFQPQTSRA